MNKSSFAEAFKKETKKENRVTYYINEQVFTCRSN